MPRGHDETLTTWWYINPCISPSSLPLQISEDWRFIALVMDRIFLWVFTVMCLSGTLGIVLKAPMLWEKKGYHNTTNYSAPIVLDRQTYYDFNPTTPALL